MGDINTGRFTAPLSGIYYFSFNGMTDESGHYAFINVRKNGVEMFAFHYNNNKNNYNTWENLSYSWTMVLKENDRVELHLGYDKELSANHYHPVWFNGHLLMQQV